MKNKDKTPIAVLISGRGSNMASILDACESPDFPAKVVVVISDNPKSAGLKIAKENGINTLVVSRSDHNSKAEFEEKIDKGLREHNVKFVCLAGFMCLLSEDFVNGWHNQILNIHPSLLPAFKGLEAHQQAIDAGVRFTGCTVHIVRPEMDTGPIIIQAVVPVTKNDTSDSLAARILHYEHVLYSEAIRLLITQEAEVKDNKVIINNGRWQKSGHVNPSPLL
jgi:phosphoribosylglycinamide formyltransferase-1